MQELEEQVQMTVADTYCVPLDTVATPYISPDFATPIVKIKEYTSRLSTTLVSWNLHQPPGNLSLERSINRGIFYGEAINTLNWQPNPYNDQFSITEYWIYRKDAEFGSDIFYLLHAKVPASQLFFTDEQLDSNEKYDYCITAVDSDGTESPRSEIVGNN
jgi:hypothetical protein